MWPSYPHVRGVAIGYARLTPERYAGDFTWCRGPSALQVRRLLQSPRWNREQTTILVPAMTDDKTRQLYRIEIG